ncbi:zinc-binding dehydrogenase [Actinomadura roseirufa]|uniref:zinc-binding dehydrogenase n=1 Tax=Actinomadura roseirufa TaxID=2094049 RepID=UPI001A9554AD|nr:zinc-binding dehydrogenase [Actinomadura roseirufa]
MSTMAAVTHGGAPGLDGVSVRRRDAPDPGPGEVLVRLRAAGLNHRDLFLADARTAADPAVTLGSDGAGVVEAAGPGAAAAPGAEVVINPCIGWDDPDDVPEVPEILGVPADGTFAEYVVVPARNVAPKPAHLDWAEAAALPLAGLTAYRALFTRGGLRAGEHVLLPGIGGGVATLALAMAKAAGATVTVTSRVPDKLRLARGLGADHALGSGDDWSAAPGGPADLVVDGVGSATFAAGVAALRPGGRLVSLGATTGADVPLSLRDLFFRQISVLGTSMGSAREFARMLEFVTEHGIRPVVHGARPLDEGPAALADLAAGVQFGKLVLSIS